MSRIPANVSRFTFEIIGFSDELRVLSFLGEEALSQLYDYQVIIACDNQHLALQGLLYKNAVLTLLDPDESRVIHGAIYACEQLDVGQRFSRYRIHLAPKARSLSLRSGHRIFQAQRIPDIVKLVLKEAGIQGNDVKFDLQASYPKKDYCVQYGESEFNFICRLLADEGIHFHFKHYLDHHQMVFSDSNRIFKPISGPKDIRYCQEERLSKQEYTIQALSYQKSVTPNMANNGDYNFQKPGLKLHSNVTKKNNERVGELEIFEFRKQSSNDNSVAHRYRDLRYQQRVFLSEDIQGDTDSVHINSGCLFAVKEHPNKKLNREYLVYRCHLQGKMPQSQLELASSNAATFKCTLKAVPSETVCRPAMNSDKPTIKGVQTAFVTGPPGAEVYTDKLGRIKVQFHWDRQGRYNEKTSCWVRVSQSIAGKEWGALSLPRVGQEVIVTFEEGDPNRPLVTACVYNSLNKPPYALPKNKSQSGIKTRSMDKGSGFNELRVEDKKNNEQLFVKAEKNIDVRVGSDKKTLIDNDCHSTVINQQNIKQGKESHETVAGEYAVKTGQSLSFSIGQDFNLKVSGASVTQVGNQLHIKGGMKTTLQAGMKLSLAVGGSSVTLDPSGVSVTGPIVRINEGGSAGSAQGASPQQPELPDQPDDDNSGKIAKSPDVESPHQLGKINFAKGKAQQVTLEMAAKARAAFVDYCPDCELRPNGNASTNTSNQSLGNSLSDSANPFAYPEDKPTSNVTAQQNIGTVTDALSEQEADALYDRFRNNASVLKKTAPAYKNEVDENGFWGTLAGVGKGIFSAFSSKIGIQWGDNGLEPVQLPAPLTAQQAAEMEAAQSAEIALMTALVSNAVSGNDDRALGILQEEFGDAWGEVSSWGVDEWAPAVTVAGAAVATAVITKKFAPLAGAASNRKLFGDRLNATVELEAKALIAKGDIDGVALSRSGIPELDLESKLFQNVAFSLKKGRAFPGTERFGDQKEFIRIIDQNAYVDEVARLYAKDGNDLNPIIRDRIKAHAYEGAEFALRDAKGLKGVPGLHAEVQSANYVLNQARATPGFDVSKVQVSTYKLQNSPGQGAPFIACNHCSGILQGFDILTGH